MTPTMNDRTAYLKGWAASERTRTFDLSAAEDRFEARYGRQHSDAFTAGWTDHASGYDKFTSLSTEEVER